MGEDNDGRFPDGSPVLVRYPRNRQEQVGDGLAAVCILPTVIAIARQAEGLGLVICLNAIPVGWPAALILACLMPPEKVRVAPARRPRQDMGPAVPLRDDGPSGGQRLAFEDLGGMPGHVPGRGQGSSRTG